jgi:hypothetical protein
MDDIIKKMCNQLSESYYGVNKRNLFEQPEGEVPSAPSDTANLSSKDKETPAENNSDVSTFDKNNTYLKGFIDSMEKYLKTGAIKNVSLNIGNLNFDKKLKRVVWSGNFNNKVYWEYVYQDGSSSNGTYFNINNEQLSTDESKAQHLINNWYNEVFEEQIKNAIDDKTLESTQTTTPPK